MSSENTGIFLTSCLPAWLVSGLGEPKGMDHLKQTKQNSSVCVSVTSPVKTQYISTGPW